MIWRAAAGVLALIAAVLGHQVFDLSSGLEDSRKREAKAAEDVRHFKGRAYWLEQRYEESVQGMRDEHTVDIFRLAEQLRSCEGRK